MELAEQTILASVLGLTKDATVFQYASVLAARRPANGCGSRRIQHDDVRAEVFTI